MSLKFRPTPFLIYRLFFIFMIYVLGIIGSSIWILESYTRVRLLPFDPGLNYDAIVASAGVTGFIGIIAGSLILGLLSERRINLSDRRVVIHDISFPDRRISINRRTVTNSKYNSPIS